MIVWFIISFDNVEKFDKVTICYLRPAIQYHAHMMVCGRKNLPVVRHDDYFPDTLHHGCLAGLCVNSCVSCVLDNVWPALHWSRQPSFNVRNYVGKDFFFNQNHMLFFNKAKMWKKNVVFYIHKCSHKKLVTI